MEQYVIDEAVRIATRSAMRGNPVARIIWIPPQTPSADKLGTFAIEYARQYTASELPPWER